MVTYPYLPCMHTEHRLPWSIVYYLQMIVRLCCLSERLLKKVKKCQWLAMFSMAEGIEGQYRTKERGRVTLRTKNPTKTIQAVQCIKLRYLHLSFGFWRYKVSHACSTITVICSTFECFVTNWNWCSQWCDLETMVSRLEFILPRSRSWFRDLKKGLDNSTGFR